MPEAGCPSHRGLTLGHMSLGVTRWRLGLSGSINCALGREATWAKFGSQVRSVYNLFRPELGAYPWWYAYKRLGDTDISRGYADLQVHMGELP
jgi:hypothetical protein